MTLIAGILNKDDAGSDKGASLGSCLNLEFRRHDFPSGRFFQADLACQNRVLSTDGMCALSAGWLADADGLAAVLQIPSSADTTAILVAAWARWNVAIARKVAGDWCLALWDEDRHELVLMRSPMGSHALYYADSIRSPAFASLAQLVPELLNVRATPNWGAIAHFAHHMTLPSTHTGFEGVTRLPAGCVAIWSEGRWGVRSLWTPEVTSRKSQNAVEFRTVFARCVAATLPKSGPIASQLSAGRDSSAVTAIAASLAPGRVVGISFAPRPGSVPPDTDKLIFDEAAVASSTATSLGIPHCVVDGGTPDEQFAWFRQLQRYAPLPLLSAPGAGLRMAMLRAARTLGARVMLTGAYGNLSLSAGGLSFLDALRREEGILTWIRTCRSLRGRLALRTIIFRSLPRFMRRPIAWLRGRGAYRVPPIWKGPLANATRALPRQDNHVVDARSEILQVIGEMEMADPAAYIHGIELRDPTASTELVEFVLSCPASSLTDGSLGRPLYEDAFADVLPVTVTKERRRGRQAADWWKAFTPEQLRAEFENLARNPLVACCIDLGEVEAYIAAWPTSAEEALAKEDLFQELFVSLSIGLFLEENLSSS